MISRKEKSIQYDPPSSPSTNAGFEAVSLTPISEHPLQPQRPMSPLPLQRRWLTPLPPLQPQPHTPLPLPPLQPQPHTPLPLPPLQPQPHAPLPLPPLQPQRLTSPPSPPLLVTSTAHTPLSTAAVSPSLSQSPSHTSAPPIPPPKSQVSKRRIKLNPFSPLRFSGANRRATTQIAEHAARTGAEPAGYEAEITSQSEVAAEAARPAAEEAAKTEEESAITMAQEEAKGNVKSHLQLILSSKPPSEEELSTVFLTCAEACETVGLDFATVLQEPLIDGRPPIYWAILNRPTTFGNGRVTDDSLVFTLLERCQPLNSSTLAAVRLACMTMSENALLQRLFRRIPELSPLSTSDGMLLGPLDESDAVDVVETRDGTGSFVAHIKILRFRLRMRVSESKCVVAEFVASGALLCCTF